MSGSSARESAAAEATRTASQNQQQLANVSLPEIEGALKRLFGDVRRDQTGNLQTPNSVHEQFNTARTGMNKDFDAAERGSSAYTTQNLKQSGNVYSKAQEDFILSSNARALEEGRSNATRNLQFQEATSGLGQFNNLMNLMQGGVGTALNLGSGFAGAQNSTLGLLPQGNRTSGVISGAMSGAATGSMISPGWGTLIGALVGAGGGYLQGGA